MTGAVRVMTRGSFISEYNADEVITCDQQDVTEPRFAGEMQLTHM